MMNSNTKMTAQELEQMIAQMEKIFTVVRILDKDLLHKMDVSMHILFHLIEKYLKFPAIQTAACILLLRCFFPA